MFYYGLVAMFFTFFCNIQVKCQSMDQIHTSLNISQAAYCINEANMWDCITCNNSNTYETKINQNGEQVIFGFNNDIQSIFVGFRGSSNMQNWIDNIQCKQISPYNDKSIYVEKGFYNLFSSLSVNIYSILDRMTKKYNTNVVFVTGHSLGGALATLLVFDIQYYQYNYNVYSLITFGSPRVGNNEFSDMFTNYKITSYRVTHYHDIVPHVPEEFLGYRHIMQEIYFSENNDEYTVCNDIEDSTCSNSCAPLHCTSTSDHMNYLNISMGQDGMCY